MPTSLHEAKKEGEWVLPIFEGSHCGYCENCSAKQSTNTSRGFELCGLCSFMYDLPEALLSASRSEALVSHLVDRASHAQHTLSSTSLGRCSCENQVLTGCFGATHSQEDGARSRKLTSRDLQPPGLSCSQVNPQNEDAQPCHVAHDSPQAAREADQRVQYNSHLLEALRLYLVLVANIALPHIPNAVWARMDVQVRAAYYRNIWDVYRPVATTAISG
jgi:hypothetical protein